MVHKATAHPSFELGTFLMCSALTWLLVASVSFGQAQGGSLHQTSLDRTTQTAMRKILQISHVRTDDKNAKNDGIAAWKSGDTAPGRFPYVFSLRNSTGDHYCSAVLIHPSFCLTAAHCVDPDHLGSVEHGAILAIGIYDQRHSGDTLQVEEVKVRKTFIHPDFKADSVHDGGDIAILQLPEQASVTPISLPDPLYPAKAGHQLLHLGWDQGSEFSNPQQVLMEVQPKEICSTKWNRIISSAQFKTSLLCAFNEEDNMCTGDSGGPLVVPYKKGSDISAGSPHLDTLVALRSFGAVDCEDSDLPSVFTPIAPYMDWILSVVPLPKLATPAPSPDNQEPKADQPKRKKKKKNVGEAILSGIAKFGRGAFRLLG